MQGSPDQTEARELTTKSRAQNHAQTMWAGDNASKWLGMELGDIDAGSAVLSLTVAKNHVNGHGICHGGVTYSLADSAFAFACNSRGGVTVSQMGTITYLAPAHLGDRLSATAHEVSLTGRNGIYDVRVTNQTGTTIAEFRGHSRLLKNNPRQES